MRVTVLGSGTSQGVPMIGCPCEVCASLDFRDKRLRSSVLIEEKGKTLVIDTGPDFRQQMLRNNVRHLDAVLFTHQHKDHIAGLDDVRAYNFFQKKDMPIYGTTEALQRIKEEYYYAFSATRYPGVPRLEPIPIHDNAFEACGLSVVPISVLHHQMPVKGFRLRDFTYITDSNKVPESEWHKLEGTRVLIINALQKEPHISHFTLSEAVTLINELAIPKAYLTHISHRLGCHEDVEAELPPHIRLAFDGLQLDL